MNLIRALDLHSLDLTAVDKVNTYVKGLNEAGEFFPGEIKEMIPRSNSKKGVLWDTIVTAMSSLLPRLLELFPGHLFDVVGCRRCT